MTGIPTNSYRTISEKPKKLFWEKYITLVGDHPQIDAFNVMLLNTDYVGDPTPYIAEI